NDPAFRGPLGRFDRLTFEAVLRENGFNEQSYVEARRRDLARGQLLHSLGIIARAPDLAVQAIYRKQLERRTLSILTVPHGRFADGPPPGEDQIVQFHREQASRFTSPEYRRLSYALIRPADAAPGIAVGEADIEAEFEARRAEFEAAETREIWQIVADEAKVREAAKRLAEGGDFLAVAKEVAGQDEAAVKLGTLARGRLPQELAAAAFALAEGAVSDAIKSPLGWHLVRVAKINPGSTARLADVHDRLKADLQRQRAAGAIAEQGNRIEDAVAAGQSLKEVANTFGLRHGEIAAVDASGRGPDGQVIESAASEPELLRRGFAQESGEEPRLHELAEGGLLLVKVEEVMPSGLRPLADVRGQVVAAIVEQRRAEAAGKRAEELAERARKGEALTDLLSGEVADVSELKPLTRAELSAEGRVATRLLEPIYLAPLGSVVTGLNATGDVSVVVRVNAIEPRDPASDPAGVARFAEAVAGSMVEDMVQQYRAAMEKQASVSVDRQRLDNLLDLQR
ncbi:MAG: hypothetical protein FJX68_00325, partial [Alphaproteobacteria bacterium]|nr:hypothetical protein [Alphaproteobacteria bacterium]